MQGLVHYSDDSSPEPLIQPQAGPSVNNARPVSKPGTPAGVILHKNSPASNPRPTKRRRQSPTPSGALSALPPDANLTQAAQSSLPAAQTQASAGKDEKPSIIDQARAEGLNDDEILDLVLRPGPLDGDEEWGLPVAVDPGECDPALSAKVEHFLRLKYEQGEHINTRLLSSSTFANPHIYSQLVDFVSIYERAPAFPSPSSSAPSGGWLTRQNLESLIPQYGPSALSARQKERDKKSEEAKKAGTKREIVFGKGKYEDGGRKDRDRDRRR
ncbi:hypothetical protein IAR50_001698 [Cryptococcus sp. DSM 104548]